MSQHRVEGNGSSSFNVVVTAPLTLTLLIISHVLIICRTTIQWPTKRPKSWPGYLHLNPGYGTTSFETVGLTGWETGSSKLRNIGIGSGVSVEANLMDQPCYATEVRGLARPTLGKRRSSRGREGMLISCDVSSLVIDTLCDQAVRGNAAVACFYIDFAARKEQSPAAILGSVLKQIVSGLDEVPEKIVKTFQEREEIIGSQRLALSEVVEFLQDISSLQCTFICIDALDECPSEHRAKLLDSLNQILQGSPCARIFLTGRPHTQGDVERYLAGRAATRSIAPATNDITIFLREKLKEDTIPDAMDESLEEEIIETIPKTASGM